MISTPLGVLWKLVLLSRLEKYYRKQAGAVKKFGQEKKLWRTGTSGL